MALNIRSGTYVNSFFPFSPPVPAPLPLCMSEIFSFRNYINPKIMRISDFLCKKAKLLKLKTPFLGKDNQTECIFLDIFFSLTDEVCSVNSSLVLLLWLISDITWIQKNSMNQAKNTELVKSSGKVWNNLVGYSKKTLRNKI